MTAFAMFRFLPEKRKRDGRGAHLITMNRKEFDAAIERAGSCKCEDCVDCRALEYAVEVGYDMD